MKKKEILKRIKEISAEIQNLEKMAEWLRGSSYDMIRARNENLTQRRALAKEKKELQEQLDDNDDE